jgi:23S rRNA (pseudouridine1915-N3)-methyltransferase
MKVTLTAIGARPSAGDAFESLTQQYISRTGAFAECGAETFRTEEAWLEWLVRRGARTAPVVVIFDSRGKSMSSEAFAKWVGVKRDEGAQHLAFAIGPAGGWSEAARQRANLQLSLGQMTLAHALARVVVAEQIYRAFTILAGHPYHTGH